MWYIIKLSYDYTFSASGNIEISSRLLSVRKLIKSWCEITSSGVKEVRPGSTTIYCLIVQSR